MTQFIEDIIHCGVHIVHAVHLEHLHGGIFARAGGVASIHSSYLTKGEGVLDELVDDACFGVNGCCTHGMCCLVVLLFGCCYRFNAKR